MSSSELKLHILLYRLAETAQYMRSNFEKGVKPERKKQKQKKKKKKKKKKTNKKPELTHSQYEF